MVLPVTSVILTAVGDVLIGLAVLRVHMVLSHEKVVDKEVIEQMHTEKVLVILGIIFIFIGLVMNIAYMITSN